MGRRRSGQHLATFKAPCAKPLFGCIEIFRYRKETGFGLFPEGHVCVKRTILQGPPRQRLKPENFHIPAFERAMRGKQVFDAFCLRIEQLFQFIGTRWNCAAQ